MLGVARMQYEYKCPDCGLIIETKRKMEDRHKDIQCHSCRGWAKLIPSEVGYRYDHTVK